MKDNGELFAHIYWQFEGLCVDIACDIEFDGKGVAASGGDLT